MELLSSSIGDMWLSIEVDSGEEVRDLGGPWSFPALLLLGLSTLLLFTYYSVDSFVGNSTCFGMEP